MTIEFDLPEEIEAQLLAQAVTSGLTLSQFVRDLVIESYLEDADDLRTVAERLADPQPGLTVSQLLQNLTD